MTPLPVTIAEVETAAKRIEPFVHETPIVRSAQLDDRFGCELLFKCENLQKSGSFKARGAHNAVFALDSDIVERGVITHSSGNHGAALALAARSRHTTARIVMPSNAPSVKKAAVEGYGGLVSECAPTLAARTELVEQIQSQTGAHLIPPYDADLIIAGQGTVGLELVAQLEDCPPDVVIVPVGGGGLLSGVAIALRSRLGSCEIIGAEPAGADDAYRSFTSGTWQPQTAPDTIADGLLTSLGVRNFQVISELVDEISLATDAQIVEAMELIWTRTKMVVEPSGAIPLAVVAANPERFAGKRVALVLSGGNVSLDHLPFG